MDNFFEDEMDEFFLMEMMEEEEKEEKRNLEAQGEDNG